jgi:hypothetical protein
MRKFQQVALVVATAGGLSAIGVGPSSADAAVAPPPAPRQDAQAATWTSSQATAQTYGSAPQQAAPQRGAEVTPQVNPQLSPKVSPQISPQAVPVQSGPADQTNLFRPYQECSPQNLLAANLPVAVLAGAETRGVSCTQANSQANALAKAN